MAAAVAPLPMGGAAAGPTTSDPLPQALAAAQVPDVAVDRRKDAAGNIVERRYVKGRLLGKVRRRAGGRAAAERRHVVPFRWHRSPVGVRREWRRLPLRGASAVCAARTCICSMHAAYRM